MNNFLSTGTTITTTSTATNESEIVVALPPPSFAVLSSRTLPRETKITTTTPSTIHRSSNKRPWQGLLQYSDTHCLSLENVDTSFIPTQPHQASYPNEKRFRYSVEDQTSHVGSISSSSPQTQLVVESKQQHQGNRQFKLPQNPALEQNTALVWWTQQQQQSRKQLSWTSSSFCRICHLPYTNNYYNSGADKTENSAASTITQMDSDDDRGCSISDRSTTNRSIKNTKTLLAYYPSLRNRNALTPAAFKYQLTPTSTDMTAPCLSSTKEDILHADATRNFIHGDDVAPTCSFCERNDFCSNCSIQACMHCQLLFCLFCRTTNENGECVCIDCCCCITTTTTNGDTTMDNRFIYKQSPSVISEEIKTADDDTAMQLD
jgi:hypothetical protein